VTQQLFDKKSVNKLIYGGKSKKVLVDEVTCIKGKDQLSNDRNINKKLTIKFVTFDNHSFRMLKI